jgi:hypothetical protein
MGAFKGGNWYNSFMRNCMTIWPLFKEREQAAYLERHFGKAIPRSHYTCFLAIQLRLP